MIMRFPSLVFVTVGLISSSLAAPSKSLLDARGNGLKFPYGSEKVRGVNLGGWFVLEPWITPSIFDSLGGAAVDEWTYCATLGKDEAYSRLSGHWNSWITQADFARIAGAGLNHVRIPIGYWSIIPNDGEPYVQGAYDVLGRALDWAAGVGIKVMIDLHGAPGSQNGFDNSGRYGAINWGTGNTVQQTLAVLNKIKEDHASHPAVAAIELLNEPQGDVINFDTIKQFYNDGWGNLVQSGVAVAEHDAFNLAAWNGFQADAYNILLDTHHYEIFDNGQVAMNLGEHIGTACAFGGQMRAVTGKWCISGEWTGAVTDCAKYLNGYGKGARYDASLAGGTAAGSCAGLGTGSVAQWPGEQKNAMRQFVEAQLDAFESASGWIFWTWKTEGAPGWDMGDLLANGVFPQPLTARNFPGQCG